jgi:hypothetical protein
VYKLLDLAIARHPTMAVYTIERMRLGESSNQTNRLLMDAYKSKKILHNRKAGRAMAQFFFEKETAPASISIDAYGHLLKLIHNEFTKIIHPKKPEATTQHLHTDHERKTCQQGHMPGRHTNPSSTRNRETSHTPRPTK